MIDFIGQLAADWPFWAAIGVAVLIWFCAYFFDVALFRPNKEEWWEDKEKRLKRESKKTKVKKIG